MRHGGGGGAVFYSELLKDPLQVLLDGAGAQFQNHSDLNIGLAVGHPGKHLSLPLSETQELWRKRRMVRRILSEKLRPRLPRAKGLQRIAGIGRDPKASGKQHDRWLCGREAIDAV